MASADNTEQGLVEIIPLEGDYPTIRLTGDALPFKGVEFATEQRVATRYYPGNPVATQLVAGPIRPPSTWSGRWMDVTLGEGGARSLVLQFETLVAKAIPVEVRWGGRQLEAGEDPAVIRRGLIKRFVPKYHLAQHIEWTIEWDWRGENLQTQAPSFSSSLRPVDDFAALVDQLEATGDATTSWTEVVWSVISAETSFMLMVSDALDDAGNAVIDAVNVLGAAASMLGDAGELTSELADRVRAVCDRTIATWANSRAALASFCGLWPGLPGLLAPGWQATATQLATAAAKAKLAMFPTDDPIDRLDGETGRLDLIELWDLLAEQAAVASANLASRQVPEIIAIVRPPAGSDLRDVAVKYYGDADDWVLIADYNDLPSSEVAGTPSGASANGAPPIYVPRKDDKRNTLPDLWGDV